MSFTKLLATGKSLIGMKDQDCPYRMRRKNLLPKFESTKNPFATPAKVEAIAATSGNGTVVATNNCVGPMETSLLFDAQLKPAVKVDAIVVPVKESRPAPAQSIPVRVAPKPASAALELPTVKPVATQPATQGRPASKPVGFPAWMKKLNPLAHLPVRQSSGQHGKSKTGRTPVQADFAWENVKVVRNDLNDTDLAVVTVPAAGKAVSERRSPSLQRTEPTTLNRLTARFFGTGQPQV
jgi:hypothetical protein